MNLARFRRHRERRTLAACVGAIIAVMFAAIPLFAQSTSTTAPQLAYEAVSIKPNRGGDTIRFNVSPDGGLTMTNGTVTLLLGQAFPQSTLDMSGLPPWTSSERFDVVAKGSAAGDKPDGPQRTAMLRAMLADRFKLKMHVKTREQPAYDLIIARSDGRLGPQLFRSDFDCAVHSKAVEAARAAGEPIPPPPTLTGSIPACTQRSGRTRFDGHMTMTSLAFVLRGLAGRPVVDKTGLTGYFTVVLDAPRSPEPQDQADGPSVFTAVQEQLGLRLVPSRTSVEVLVIDSIERPTEN